jgi:hypothetical protein
MRALEFMTVHWLIIESYRRKRPIFLPFLFVPKITGFPNFFCNKAEEKTHDLLPKTGKFCCRKSLFEHTEKSGKYAKDYQLFLALFSNFQSGSQLVEIILKEHSLVYVFKLFFENHP